MVLVALAGANSHDNPLAVDVWPSVMQAPQQNFSRPLGQWLDHFLSRLMDEKADPILPPLDILKPKDADPAAAHCVRAEQVNDGKVVQGRTRRAGDAIKHFLCILRKYSWTDYRSQLERLTALCRI